MGSADPTDFELLARWRAGDRGAGPQLFGRHFAAVYWFFRNKLDDGADDLTQRVFLALVERPEGPREAASFRAYLFGIARNQLLMWLRSHHRHQGPIDPGSWSIVDAKGSPARIGTHHEQQRLIHEALAHLAIDQQVAIELHYMDDLSSPEIAEVLGVPVGTVKARLSRAREALRQRLADSVAAGALLDSTIDELERWIRALPACIPHASPPGEQGHG